MTMRSFDAKRAIGAFRETISAELTPAIQLKFPYSIPARITHTTLVASGTVTQANSMALVNSGAATSSSALLDSHDSIVYQPGQGGLTRFTAVFTTGVAGNTQEIGLGDATDGYFIGYNGATFSVNRRQNGTDNWTAIPNVGNSDGTFRGRLDPTKGNVYQIQYQWLGFGAITWSIFNPDRDAYEILHRDEYVNENIVPSTYNPSFPFRIFSENTTNNTAITISCASAGAYIEGRPTKLTNLYSSENSKTITTELNILTMRVRSTFNSKTTRALVFPKYISAAAEGSKPVVIRVYEDATLGGTPSYSNIDTNESVVEVDTAGTTVTGGYKLMTFVVSKTGQQTIDLSKAVRVHNSDTITVTAQSVNSSEVDVGISWEELI